MLGRSAWRNIGQDRIAAFADITEDHNFIHLDEKRVRAETAFQTTIAHGFLTLSLLSAFANDVIPKLKGQTAAINYGFDEIRFIAPVPAGSRIRGNFTLLGLSTRQSGHVQLTWRVEVEIEGQERPALVARWITLAMMEEAS
ncbi:MaoC family dehydratase [Notoacmeibacter sp. MSK16QG-6]|uniref:MaoC family dehydratase n=1 Tax=Notoacmeibacter sp. MSK16QG-6 TaxID=2957982 RepID=UPI00209EC7AC|nr:MaoC family dehydratase [Notoacmeibacter sp. MSK16QG-6]MCP1200340.1 MaoC family dehydratase [Notoacmeibacter sp. MSK16QG-6]